MTEIKLDAKALEAAFLEGWASGHNPDYDDAWNASKTKVALPDPAPAEREAGEAVANLAQNGNRPLSLDRDILGRLVREVWVRWAKTQPSPKPSWLVPYDELAEPDKEADRQIGETAARWAIIYDAANLSGLIASPNSATTPPMRAVLSLHALEAHRPEPVIGKEAGGADRAAWTDAVYDKCARVAERYSNAIVAAAILEEKEWEGLSCACGGGWKVGHRFGCPECDIAAAPLTPGGQAALRHGEPDAESATTGDHHAE